MAFSGKRIGAKLANATRAQGSSLAPAKRGEGGPSLKRVHARLRRARGRAGWGANDPATRVFACRCSLLLPLPRLAASRLGTLSLLRGARVANGIRFMAAKRPPALD